MPLTLYRRHTKACAKQYPLYDRTKTDCRCLIHVEGQLGDEFLRRSTGTRTWQQALGTVRDATRLGAWTKEKMSKKTELVSYVVDLFLADCESPTGRHLSRATIIKYKTVLKGLVKFCNDKGIKDFDKVDFHVLHAYRQTWLTAARASTNNIARLRTFYSYAVQHKLATSNIAKELRMPRGVAPVERMPFEEHEMEKILEAARTVKLDPQQTINNHELETFILVQRYGALAIADAALLKISELKGDEIRYFRKKLLTSASSKLVRVPLPDFVLAKLRTVKVKQGKYFFCTGSDSIHSAVEAWGKRLKKVFDAAGITAGSSHRFRHTFAYELLTQGVSLERVSKWMGHTSIEVTNSHYNHFLERRIQADNDVLRKLYAKQNNTSSAS